MAQHSENTTKKPISRARRIWITALALAVLSVWSYGAYRWLQQPREIVTEFRDAITSRDAKRLSTLAPRGDTDKVTSRAEEIWSLASATGNPDDFSPRACRIELLPSSTIDLLKGHRDLFVVAMNPDSGEVRNIFYYRVRAGRLHAGADPNKFQQIEQQAQRILAQITANDQP